MHRPLRGPMYAGQETQVGSHTKVWYAQRRACRTSQRSLHNAPIFRLLLKVAVKGTHQCDFDIFAGAHGPQHTTTPILIHRSSPHSSCPRLTCTTYVLKSPRTSTAQTRVHRSGALQNRFLMPRAHRTHSKRQGKQQNPTHRRLHLNNLCIFI